MNNQSNQLTTSTSTNSPSPSVVMVTSDLKRVAESRLRDSGYQPLRFLKCTCRGDVVIIDGRVPSFFLKQMAQTFVGKLESVRRVENNVEVVDDARDVACRLS